MTEEEHTTLERLAERVEHLNAWLFDPPTSDTQSRADQIDRSLAVRRFVMMSVKALSWLIATLAALTGVTLAIREALEALL